MLSAKTNRGISAVKLLALALSAFAIALACCAAPAYADEASGVAGGAAAGANGAADAAGTPAIPSDVQSIIDAMRSAAEQGELPSALPVSDEQRALLKQALERAAEEARNIMDTVPVSLDGADVPDGTDWITPEQKQALQEARDAAQKAAASISEGVTIDVAQLNDTLGKVKEALDAAKADMKGDESSSAEIDKQLKQALGRVDKAIAELDSHRDQMNADQQKMLDTLKTNVSTARLLVDSGLVTKAMADGMVNGLDRLADLIDLFEKTLNSRFAAKPTAATGLVYNGKEQVGVAAGSGYTVSGGSATNAGSYTAKATLATGYIWADGKLAPVEVKYTIAKAPQTIKAGKTSFTVKAKQVKKKAKKLAVPFAAEGGSCTWAKAKSTAKGAKSAKATPGKVVIAKNGKITVKKGAKKGSYTLKVKVSAPASANYNAASKTVTLTVKVK